MLHSEDTFTEIKSRFNQKHLNKPSYMLTWNPFFDRTFAVLASIELEFIDLFLEDALRFSIGLRSGGDEDHTMSFSPFMAIAANATEILLWHWL